MDEIIAWLLRLIDYDTTAGGSDAEACVRFIQQTLSARGVDVRTFSVGDGPRARHLLAEVPGARPETVMLHAHLDTADFGEAGDWLFPARPASRRRGCVCGRGAIDCKGPLAVWMKLLSDAAESGTPPYTLKLLVSDLEEQGGEAGLGLLLAQRPGILSEVKLVVGEGGGYPLPFREHICFTFQTGEREPADALRPKAGDEPEWEEIERILSLGAEKGYYSRLTLAYAREAASLTGRRLDIRPLYEGMEGFFEAAPVSRVCARFGPPFEAALREALPGARLLPCVTPGYSDNRFFRRAGIPTAGFFPLEPKNSLGGIHGANEYISEASLELAYRVMSRALEGLGPAPAP